MEEPNRPSGFWSQICIFSASSSELSQDPRGGLAACSPRLEGQGQRRRGTREATRVWRRSWWSSFMWPQFQGWVGGW